MFKNFFSQDVTKLKFGPGTIICLIFVSLVFIGGSCSRASPSASPEFIQVVRAAENGILDLERDATKNSELRSRDIRFKKVRRINYTQPIQETIGGVKTGKTSTEFVDYFFETEVEVAGQVKTYWLRLAGKRNMSEILVGNAVFFVSGNGEYPGHRKQFNWVTEAISEAEALRILKYY